MGAPTLGIGVGAPTYDFAKISEKLYEVYEIWQEYWMPGVGRGGGGGRGRDFVLIYSKSLFQVTKCVTQFMGRLLMKSQFSLDKFQACCSSS